MFKQPWQACLGHTDEHVSMMQQVGTSGSCVGPLQGRNPNHSHETESARRAEGMAASAGSWNGYGVMGRRMAGGGADRTDDTTRYSVYESGGIWQSVVAVPGSTNSKRVVVASGSRAAIPILQLARDCAAAVLHWQDPSATSLFYTSVYTMNQCMGEQLECAALIGLFFDAAAQAHISKARVSPVSLHRGGDKAYSAHAAAAAACRGMQRIFHLHEDETGTVGPSTWLLLVWTVLAALPRLYLEHCGVPFDSGLWSQHATDLMWLHGVHIDDALGHDITTATIQDDVRGATSTAPSMWRSLGRLWPTQGTLGCNLCNVICVELFVCIAW